MATFTVWKFPTPTGADDAVATLGSLEKQELISVHDAATVSWPVDRRRPKTRQLDNLAAGGALGGAFWGLLFGLLFFVPLVGMALGAAAGAIGGAFGDVGIDDDFIATVRSRVQPGTSALFVMTSGAVLDKVHEAFAGCDAELVQTNLSGEEEARLLEAFAV